MPMLDRLARLFHEVFDHDPGRFSKETLPEDVAKWDSLGHMNLVGALEREFELEFEIDEIMEMASVARILEILKARGVPD